MGVDLYLICREHDIAYDIGGTQEDKNRADNRMKYRVYRKLRKKHSRAVASTAYVIFIGVVLGGIARFNYTHVPNEPPEYGER